MYALNKILYKSGIRSKWILVYSLIFFSYSLSAQLKPDNLNDYVANPQIQVNTAASTIPNSEYGGAFTPRGALKALIIFVTFKNNTADANNTNWPASQEYPNWILDNSFIFTNLSDFDNIPTSNRSLSYYYYLMTKELPLDERFKFYGGWLSVQVDPTGVTDWDQMSLKVFAALKAKYVALDNILPQYDERTGPPNYQYDNSINPQPDGNLDFVVVDYRYNGSWNDSQAPLPGMNKWTGSGGGYAAVPYYDFGNYKVTTGFTGCDGMGPSLKLYTHEIGHTMFNAPHYGAANNVLGKYLFSNTFWGMMSSGGIEIYACANAWERWYLGWINLKYDLSDKSQNGDYVLRDYVNTGDAMRIKLPYVSNQYIWLENHQGTNTFDSRNDYNTSLCGYTLPKAPTGLMVYGEHITDSKSNVNTFVSGANGLRFFNRAGNYDFTVTQWANRWEWCNNYIGDFSQGLPNPYNGYSTASKYLYDKNGDNVIDYTTDANAGPKEEALMIWNNDKFDYGNFAPNGGFQVNDEIGIGTNPAIKNFQVYNQGTQALSPIYLNGISIKVISKDQYGDLTVSVKFDDYNFNNDIRMCGNIIYPPATVNINPNVNIQIDRSGTPNRTTLRDGRFVNPTIVSTSSGTYLKLFNNASMTIENQSGLVLVSNSSIELDDNSRLIVKSGSMLEVKSGSNIIVKGNGQIVIENGGYLCVESGANINLQDNLSVINFHSGANTGVSPYVLSTDPGTCQSSVSSIAYTGNGSINQFVNDVYIQDETITSNRYVTGRNIYVGSAVTTSKPQGPVIVKNGYEIIFDSEGVTSLNNGFQAESGGTFEMNNK